MGATKIANGQTTDAGQFNGLVDDVDDPTTGHRHTGAAGGGRKVNHSDLVDSGIDGGLTHAEIDAHVGSTPGTGSSGVHGLQSTAVVMGLLGGSQYAFEVGSAAPGALVTTTLDTIVGVLVAATWSDWGVGCPPLAVASVPEDHTAASTFYVQVDFVDRSHPGTVGLVYWMAWGTKA